MRRFSISLSALADRIDEFADRVEELEGKISGFKVWRYPGLTRKLEALENDKRILIEEYLTLSRLYAEKTGEKAPVSTVVIAQADFEPVFEAMRRLAKIFEQFTFRH